MFSLENVVIKLFMHSLNVDVKEVFIILNTNKKIVMEKIIIKFLKKCETQKNFTLFFFLFLPNVLKPTTFI